MSTPTNIPETPMGETEQDSFSKSKEKFQQQLQDIFQTILRLTGPDQFDQLCQWMEYNQYRTIDDFYDSSYNDPEKFDTKGPATEYKWKGKMNHLSPIVAQKLKCFVRWMTHEDRPYELHDDFLATLTRDNYLKFRHMDSQSFSASSPSHHEPYKLKTSFLGESKHQTPSESQTALNNYKKGPQRKASFSQQEEISDDDEYANAEEQFSTDPEPEEHSPYSVYQSSFHPKMPQKSFLPPNTWETLSESTKLMIIEHNKKVKLNNPTPYPSGSKTKPNPTLGKSTPAPKQVHQHSQDEPTEESPSDTSTQTLVNKCLAESGIDPTDIQKVMSVSHAKRDISSHGSSRQIQTHQRYVFARVNQSKHHNCDDLDPTDTPSAVPTALQAPSDDTYNPKCTHSLMETQCHHSQYPILMKQNCTHNSSTSQVSKSYHPNPVTFPYPPDPGEILTDDTNTIIIRSAVRSATKTSPNLRLDPPKGEDQPQDLTSDVFVYGRPNPDGSDNTPPMSIVNFDDLLGRTFLLPMDENGERKRATISEHVKDLCQQQVSREDQLRFKLKIDGDQLDDLISYNQLMEYLEDKTDTGPLEDGLNRSKCIKDHKGPYTSSDPEYNGSSYNLLIEWEPGEHVLETSSAPTTLVERDKLDLSSLIPPKGEMESSFSWTCPFKSPTSSTLCFGEPTLGKLNQETDFYMTKHMPKPSSGANRVSVSHSSLVTKNGEHFYGENFIHDFPKSWKHIKEVDWGDELKLNYTTYGYMLMEIDWGGKFNCTSCGYPMANWQGHETHPTGYKTSEVDWGGHDPNPNHVSESLLSEVDWEAHNPDADDPEQLTGESIQSFLTFIVQLQWLVALGRLVTHAQVTTLSKLMVASS